MNSIPRRWLVLTLSACAACGGGGGSGGASTAVAPENLSYPEELSLFVVQVPAPPNAPTVEGDVDQFTIDPALPPGLALDASSGVIAGLPTAPSARRLYTVLATNSGGSAQFDLEIQVTAPQRFAYVTSRDDGSISIFSADVVSGRLQRKGFFVPPAGEDGPERMAVHPSGAFAYVPNLKTDNVSVYAIDPLSGNLTPGDPVPAGIGPHAIAIDPAGGFASVASAGSHAIAMHAVDPHSGALAPIGAPVLVATPPTALAFDPTGQFLFVALRGQLSNGAGSAVAAYSVNAETGAITAIGSPLGLGTGQPVDLAVDPARPNLYVIREADDSVQALAYDPTTGALTASASDAAGDQPAALAVDPTGRFAYVANALDGTVSSFAIDAGSGALAATGTVDAGASPADVRVDPSGRHLYVVARDARELVRFAIDRDTGTLSLRETIAARGTPDDIAFVQGGMPTVWTPRSAHTTNAGSGDFSTFSIAGATGALTELGSPLLVGVGPVSIAVDPRLRWLFVANQSSASLVRFRLDRATGEPLEGGSSLSIGGQPTHATIDPSGRFLFLTARDVIEPNDGWLSTFAIDPLEGSLEPIDVQAVGFRPTWVATDPTGEFLYVANSGNGAPGTSSITVLDIATDTGIPTVSAPAVTAPGAYAIAFHPNRRYAYGLLRSADVTVRYAIDPVTGGLEFQPGGSRAGFGPSALSITPDGRFGYVACLDSAGSGHVAMYRIDDESGGLIAPPELFLDGTHPVDLQVDPSGRYLFVANSGSDTVSAMTIDPLSGMLTIGTPVATGVAPSAVAVTGFTH